MASHVTTYGTVKLDARGCVALELTCVSCGYDLRGLPPAGDCPECGAAIQESLPSRPAPGAWRTSAIPVSVAAVFTVLALVCYHLYVYCHAAGRGPIDLFHTLTGVCSLVVFVACVAAFVYLYQYRSLGKLVAFIVALGLFLVSFLASAVTV